MIGLLQNLHFLFQEMSLVPDALFVDFFDCELFVGHRVPMSHPHLPISTRANLLAQMINSIYVFAGDQITQGRFVNHGGYSYIVLVRISVFGLISYGTVGCLAPQLLFALYLLLLESSFRGSKLLAIFVIELVAILKVARLSSLDRSLLIVVIVVADGLQTRATTTESLSHMDTCF